MTRPRRATALAAACALGFLCTTVTGLAQDTTRVQADTSRPARTTPPPEPAATPAGPLAPGSRMTFTRDSLVWSGAQTLADLLGRIPGVHVARAGFLGLPEYLQYGGRGGSALEVFWDGVPLEPLGTDSLFTDPGRIPLSYLDRVDVEVLPAALRVHLVSERHSGLEPRTMVRIMSGAFRTGAYVGLFQQRWPSGIGLSLAGDFFGTDGSAGPGRSDQRFDLWAKLGWHPTPRVGMTYQLRRQDHTRTVVNSPTGALAVPRSDGTRTDVLFAIGAGTAPRGRGVRVDFGLAASSWSSDSGLGVPDQQYRQAHLGMRVAQSTWSAEVRGRVADARTPYQLQGRAGWVLLPGVIVSGDVDWRRHDGGRTSVTLHGAAGLYRGPLSIVAEAARRDAVQTAALRDDAPILTTDQAVRVGLETGPLGGRVALVRRDAFAPLAYPDLRLIPTLAPSPAATFVVASAYIRPSSALTLSAWYADPVEGTAAGLEPPRHARGEITLRSKFWRTFRSGAFDLKLTAAMESWSAGAAGGAVPLPGATFYEMSVQFQIVGFVGFWDLRNVRLTDAGYVPGLPYPGNAQTFGVRWEFSN